VEDTDTALEDLERVFPPHVVAAVHALTKNRGESKAA
jgi:(p)ppGpp synthase/HD superfamily hydrolase